MEFFYRTNLKLLDDKTKLLRYIKSRITYHDRPTYAEKGHFRSYSIPEELVKNTLEAVEIPPAAISAFWFTPHSVIEPHVDYPCPYHDNWKIRKSCLTWALEPDYENFAPTIFHDDDNNKFYCHYDEHGVILNTRCVHSMVNNEHNMYMLQFNYENDPEDFHKILI
jgi:hypothetical protein